MILSAVMTDNFLGGVFVKSKKLISIFTAAAVALQITSFAAFADNTADSVTDAVFTNNVQGADALPEQSELEAMYLEQLFYGDSGISLYSDYGARVLTGGQKSVYDWLKAKIEGVADGTITKAVFRFEDTQNQYAFSGGAAQLSEDFGKVFDYILFDLPASFYWYDKTVGCSYSYGTRDGVVYLEVHFVVSENYADPNSDYYGKTSYHVGVDASKINKAKTAVANAKKIAAKYTDKSNYEKIMGFKDEICALTEYNYDAVDNTSTPYGDPWQLVWVFDGDASTNVVCEGYSKAFQYLCDLGGVDCYSVNGFVNGGGHMWNIVRLYGKSYAVDITNCDDGMAGSPDYLCLKGAQSADSSGFVMHIVKSYMDKTITYKYKLDTVDTYTPDILTVSTTDFDPNEVHVHNWNAWTVTKAATCAENGSKTRVCADCGETQTEIIAKTNAHSFSEVKYDANGHWHVCAVCKTAKGDKTAHTFTEKITKQPTATTEGVKTYTCSCGYSKTEKIGVLVNTAVTYNSPVNGTLTVTVNGKKLQSGDKVKMGDKIVVSAAPKTGCKVGYVKINGAAQTLSGGTVTYNVKGVEGTVAITAAFEYITPTVVKNFKSMSAYSSSAVLTWSKNAANTTKYEINYRSSANESWTTKTANAAATSLTLTGLKPNTKYTVAIRAVNNNVRSAWTYVNGTSKTVLTAPSAVSGFKLKSRTMNTASFTWNKASDAGGYRIWTKAPGDSTWTRRANITNVNTTSATVSGLKANTKYSVLIRAVSKSNSALLSNCVYLNAQTLAKPAATANFAVKTRTMTSAALTWTKNDEATGYRIWISADGGKSWKRVANPTANAVSAQIKGLNGGTKYIVRMAAMKDTVVGYYSDVNLTTYAKPVKTSGFATTSVKSTSVSLKWNKNVDASSYRIWVSTDSGKSWKRVANPTVNAVSAQITGLQGGTKYIVRMAAMKGTTVGYYSDVNLTTYAKPVKTSGFTATSIKSTSVSLKWNKNVDASSYRIWVSTDGGKSWKRVANPSVNAVSAQITGLKRATNYVIRMAAVNGTTVVYYSDVNVKTAK